MRVTNADLYRASTMYNNYNAHVGSELGSRDPFSKENRVSSEILCRMAFISTMPNNYNTHVGSELGSGDPFSKDNRASSEILCRRAFISTSKFNHSSDMLMEKIKAAR